MTHTASRTAHGSDSPTLGPWLGRRCEPRPRIASPGPASRCEPSTFPELSEGERSPGLPRSVGVTKGTHPPRRCHARVRVYSRPRPPGPCRAPRRLGLSSQLREILPWNATSPPSSAGHRTGRGPGCRSGRKIPVWHRTHPLGRGRRRVPKDVRRRTVATLSRHDHHRARLGTSTIRDRRLGLRETNCASIGSSPDSTCRGPPPTLSRTHTCSSILPRSHRCVHPPSRGCR